MHRAALLLCMALAACATPQEACIGQATRELRTLDGLLAEVQANLDRGYALEERTRWRMDWRICEAAVAATADTPAVPAKWCWVREPYTVTDRVPIDPEAERRKLAGLKAHRAREFQRAQTAVAECRVLYPE